MIERSLARRILVAAIVCGVMGAVMVVAVGRLFVLEAIRHTVAAVGRDAFVAASRSECQRDPEHWHFEDPERAYAYAYDATTLRSRNPDAPPLDRQLLAAAGGEGVAAEASAFGRGRYVFRVAEAGECAIVQGSWHARPAPRILGGLVATMFVVGVVAAALAFLLVVRPLVQRIARLRRAVENVGDDAFVAPELPVPPDEIGVVVLGMVRAHERILADTVRLAERQRALERHLGDIAHDLRTPLASLQMTLERIASADVGSDLVNAALRDVIYITGLGANLRLASRLQDGWDPAVEPPASLGEIVVRVGERFRFLAERKTMSLEIATPDAEVLVQCAYLGCEQALTNIVENALAHGDPGGHVAIVLERSGDRFTLEVLDDGPGVVPGSLPRLGERAFRTDAARQRDPRGSGLGLAIVTEICERCGFVLAFEAVHPRGLRVRIDGPALPA